MVRHRGIELRKRFVDQGGKDIRRLGLQGHNPLCNLRDLLGPYGQSSAVAECPKDAHRDLTRIVSRARVLDVQESASQRFEPRRVVSTIPFEMMGERFWRSGQQTRTKERSRRLVRSERIVEQKLESDMGHSRAWTTVEAEES
ncbi:MAG: hypothetical protein QM784_13110 [Polyangiaceae bacterium]